MCEMCKIWYKCPPFPYKNFFFFFFSWKTQNTGGKYVLNTQNMQEITGNEWDKTSERRWQLNGNPTDIPWINLSCPTSLTNPKPPATNTNQKPKNTLRFDRQTINLHDHINQINWQSLWQANLKPKRSNECVRHYVKHAQDMAVGRLP